MYLKGQKPRYTDHEAFAFGVELAHDVLDDCDEDENLTLAEVIKDIDQSLSWKNYHKECLFNKHLNMEVPDFAYHVGCTYEWFRQLVEHNRISDLSKFLPSDDGNDEALDLPMAA
jgi:hypothetical protein